MLTPPDEQFTHQVAFPHAMVGSSDPAWRERYWVSIQDVVRGDTVVSFGFGQYPNQDVQEGFVIAATGGRQHNLRLSRSLLPDSHRIAVGPMAVEVLEPLTRLRFVLDENPSGLAFDLEWVASFPAFLEDRHFETSRARVTHDLIRYVQVGRAEGELTIDGRSQTLTTDEWWGERDHSWGIRPLPRAEGGPPTERPGWRFLMFCPLQLETFGLHLYLYEDAKGRPLHLSAGILEPATGGDDADRVLAVDHDLRWEPGAPTPTMVGGDLQIELESGRTIELALAALPGRAHLRGGGYGGTNGWFQGQWRGDSLEHEVWDLTDPDQLRSHGQFSSDHLLEVRGEGEVGHGIIEYMVLPGHHRYGHARGTG